MSGPFPILAGAPNLGGVYPTGPATHPGGAHDATPGGGGGEPGGYLGTLLPAPAAPLADTRPEDDLGAFDAAQQAAEERAAREAFEAAERARAEREAREAREQAEREALEQREREAAETLAQQAREREARERTPQPPVIVGETPQPITGGGGPPIIVGEKPQPITHG